MTIDDVKQLVREYVERVWNGGDEAALERLTQTDFTYQLGGQLPRDRAALASFIRETHAAFPDWRVEIADLVAEEDVAAVRWHGRVTHSGPFRGIPPTGRTIPVSGINVYRIAGGLIAAEWEQTDSLGMVQQLGMLRPT